MNKISHSLVSCWLRNVAVVDSCQLKNQSSKALKFGEDVETELILTPLRAACRGTVRPSI